MQKRKNQNRGYNILEMMATIVIGVVLVVFVLGLCGVGYCVYRKHTMSETTPAQLNTEE
jgi:prepilin-type N-terminal cleavage/methylation domain-containing protein